MRCDASQGKLSVDSVATLLLFNLLWAYFYARYQSLILLGYHWNCSTYFMQQWLFHISIDGMTFLLTDHIPYQILREVIGSIKIFLFSGTEISNGYCADLIRLQNNFLAKIKIVPIISFLFFLINILHTHWKLFFPQHKLRNSVFFLKFDIHLQFPIWFKLCN